MTSGRHFDIQKFFVHYYLQHRDEFSTSDILSGTVHHMMTGIM